MFISRRLVQTVAALGVASALLLQPTAGTRTADAFDYSKLTRMQKRILSGFADFALNPDNNNTPTRSARRATSYFPTDDDGCRQNLASNVKVNQNCLNLTDTDLQGRGQANNETAIAQDPLHPSHLVAGFNDYRRGDGNCYGAYSLDRGRTWSDTTIPMGFTRGEKFGAARQYWGSGGDTAVAWDTKGNAYFQCQVFNRGTPVSSNPDQSSGVYVFRSTGNFGASWNFPGRPVTEYADVTGATNGAALEDKPYMTVDSHAGSPFQDRVYVSWTEFLPDGTAYIWLSASADYGEHFGERTLVSQSSPLCALPAAKDGSHGPCDTNQFSQPFTGPDGALYVVWANFNNAVAEQDNRNQLLLAKSMDGGLTFSAPIKVADYYDLPDCATYQGGQDPGRACVPEKGAQMNSVFRATNYPSGAVNETKPREIAVTFGSYINAHSQESNGCVPAGLAPDGNNQFTGVKTPGACNNDILVSVSTDGGATFTGTSTDPRRLTSATQDRRQATTDQFWQWATFTRDGRLAVSYYDRQYGDDETTGFMDVSLSGSRDLVHFGTRRVTSGSMPTPTEFPNAQGNSIFFGDYSGLTAVDADAHPMWMDTRNADLFVCPGTGAPGVPPAVCRGTEPNGLQANDQEILTAEADVPTR